MKTIGFLLAGLFLCAPLLAREVPAPTGKYVSDFADLLSARARVELEDRLAAFDRESSTQILVVTIPSLEGDVLEDFSIRLAEKWKPGSAKNDNGAILLVSKADRAVRIEVGYGLEGALPDALAKRIIENEIVPRFRGGDFDGGVDVAVSAMIKAAKGEYSASADSEDPIEKYAPAFYWGLILYFFLPYVAYALILFFGFTAYGLPGLGVCLALVFFLHLIRLAVFSKAFFNSSDSGRRSGHGGGWGGGYGGGGFSGGGFSGGGFSGGGGSFGGGGAGGRW